MICFLVPVKSSQLASDWSHFSKLVKRSLKSISSQKDKNFQIIISCHELPEEKFEHQQLHYVQVDFNPPKLTHDNWEEDRQRKEGDKARKIMAGFAYANENFDVDYFMVVDSDDCIHNGISKFVNSNLQKNIPGWYVNKGYFYREGQKLAWKIRSNFNLRCGSCIIIRKDLFNHLILKEPFLYYYHEMVDITESASLLPLPFLGTIYSMANGENHFMSPSKMIEMVNQTKFYTLDHLKSVYSKLTRYRPTMIGNRFKNKFTFYDIPS
ncbi:MAG: glycosyltransferase family A protein [Croceivirga sp.]